MKHVKLQGFASKKTPVIAPGHLEPGSNLTLQNCGKDVLFVNECETPFTYQQPPREKNPEQVDIKYT